MLRYYAHLQELKYSAYIMSESRPLVLDDERIGCSVGCDISSLVPLCPGSRESITIGLRPCTYSSGCGKALPVVFSLSCRYHWLERTSLDATFSPSLWSPFVLCSKVLRVVDRVALLPRTRSASLDKMLSSSFSFTLYTKTLMLS